MDLPVSITLDASALAHSSCQYKLWRTVVDGYREKTSTVNIEFGTAFHKFRHIFRETGDFGGGCLAAKKHLTETPFYTPKMYSYLNSTSYLLLCCTEYANTYENDNYKSQHLEMRFIFPYYVDDLLEVAIAGTMDDLGSFGNSIGGLCDCKTSSTPEHKIDKKLKSYSLSNQLLFYYWCLKQYGAAFPDTPIGQMCNYDIAIFVDGVFPQGKDKVILRRSPMWIPPQHTYEEYATTLKHKLDKVIIPVFRETILSGKLPPRDGIIHGTCTSYNLCSFFDSCNAPDADCQQALLDKYLKREEYNPLTHQE